MSKFISFDFRCESCGVWEDMVKPDVFVAPCPACGKDSNRIISGTRLDPRMGVDPDFATMADKWAKQRTKRAKIDRAHYKEHGTDRAYGADVQ